MMSTARWHALPQGAWQRGMCGDEGLVTWQGGAQWRGTRQGGDASVSSHSVLATHHCGRRVVAVGGGAIFFLFFFYFFLKLVYCP